MKTLLTHPIAKTIAWMVLIISLALSCGCTKEELYQEETYFFFNPEHLDSIYVNRDQARLSTATKIKNGEGFTINFKETETGYSVSITSDHEFVWPNFTGYDAPDYWEDQPWEDIEGGYRLEDENLLPPMGGYYQISISE